MWMVQGLKTEQNTTIRRKHDNFPEKRPWPRVSHLTVVFSLGSDIARPEIPVGTDYASQNIQIC